MNLVLWNLVVLLVTLGLAGPVLPCAVAREDVALVGRFTVEEAGDVTFAWPASSVGATFLGTSLAVRIEDIPVFSSGETAWHNAYDVVVDGAHLPSLTITPGIDTYVLAPILPSGVHTVWLRKRTEAFVGTARFWQFDPGPQGILLRPPTRRSRHMTVIGASNETGYGATQSVSADAMCNFSSGTQDALGTFAARAADALQADLTLIAYSGKGVARNYDGSTTQTMVDLYSYANPNQPFRQQASYELYESVPDAVLIDLGGNDWAQGAPNRDTFVGAYRKLILAVRQHAAQTPIFLLLNPMQYGSAREALRESLQRVVGMAADGGDMHVAVLEFAPYQGTTFGCDFHPDAALHAAMAQKLIGALQATLGW